MNTTVITSTHDAVGRIDRGAVARIAGMVSAVGGKTDRWPWPLPVNSILAVFDDRTSALNVRAALGDAGVEVDDVWQVSGEAGARWLRQTYTRRSILARLLSLLGDEHEIVGRLGEMSLHGATITLVQAGPARMPDVLAIVTDQNARAVRLTRRWTADWRERSRR